MQDSKINQFQNKNTFEKHSLMVEDFMLSLFFYFTIINKNEVLYAKCGIENYQAELKYLCSMKSLIFTIR
ncbi:hypothetical protein TTHERM_01431560 (macronuclear) [Tetrahymena thermophila SB210]|uniref:Uncharacterized protein n=1 Tax=Tetrahymena thermophila (strain SB210) TaxID=312017 RepID=Q24JG6_TETTS|nr:hypothetical protein TTHERM_01431560 [Tetrahymena thermophila SB210]EAS07925.1 hypothetical protein TTHERM_01431560 [Tetrahymena thermophila SB210]|eukprot:XP_001028167.1 hypothetical protein TTHERM_01431560 [Tetrahymena thermophila SB210]